MKSTKYARHEKRRQSVISSLRLHLKLSFLYYFKILIHFSLDNSLNSFRDYFFGINKLDRPLSPNLPIRDSSDFGR